MPRPPATDPTDEERQAFLPGVFGRIPSVWLVAGGGWIGRGTQLVAQLVAIRILMEGLGTAGYGAFAVLASLQGWLLLGDLCLGISVQNHISERRAAGKDADDVVLTGAVLSFGFAMLVALLLLLAGPWLSRLLLGGFAFLSPSERALAFYALAFPAVGNALGGVVYRVWFAQHRGYLSNLMPAAGTVTGTLGVWLLHRGTASPGLAATTLVYYAPLAILPVLALALTVIRVARHHRFRPELVRPLLSRGFVFWVSGLLAAAVLQVDYIIMVQVLPVRDIVVYNIASKLFYFVFLIYNALLLAVWPVCSEAIARDDWAQVWRMVRRYIALGMVFTAIAGVAIAVANPWVVRLLAPGLDQPLPLVVIGLLTVYTLVRVWTDMFGIVLQSMNDIRILWAIAIVQAALSIGLQTLGARMLGLPGMILGLTGCYLLTAAWALPLRCRLHARRPARAG